MAHVVDRRHARLPVDRCSREEIIAVAKSPSPVAGRPLKRLLRPALAVVVARVVQDAVRSKCELVAENAMLRQQLIVAGRSAT